MTRRSERVGWPAEMGPRPRVATPVGAANDGADAESPRLGGHTSQLLLEIGFTDHDIDSLEDEGVVSGPPSPEREARAARLVSMLARVAEPDDGPEPSAPAPSPA